MTGRGASRPGDAPEPGQLFDLTQFDQPAEQRPEAEAAPVVLAPGERLVRVLPDVSGLDKEFDYLVPARWAEEVAVGSLVRVDLHGRRVAGWVVALDPAPTPGVALRPISKLSSVGPPDDVIELARWAAHRWAGRVAPVLKTASPATMVRAFPRRRTTEGRAPRPSTTRGSGHDSLAADALSVVGVSVVQVGPTDDQYRIVLAAADLGDALVVVPEVGRARWLAGRLGRDGHRVHLQPGGWAGGPAGGVVIGSRSAVWAPVGDLRSVVVLDEHEESLQEERNPTWHGRDVAIERARRAGVPCLLVSPTPSLAATAAADRHLKVARTEERRGWAPVEVIDRRDDEPGWSGLFPPRTADLIRRADRAVAVLNRKGRAQMLACASCGELVRTEDDQHLMIEVDNRLVAPRTGESRPLICARCTGTTLKRIRLGVTRATEELAALVGRPVIEISSDSRLDGSRDGDGVYLGTEAALRAGIEADLVVFLDFDQELHAPRYRAAEQAMWLLARASRLVGGRRPGARIVVQTRTPEHRVITAAVGGDPGRMLADERALRSSLGFPPDGALAELSGQGAPELVAGLSSEPVTVLGPRDDGRYLIRADNADQLAGALAAVPRPAGRVRTVVDPPRA